VLANRFADEPALALSGRGDGLVQMPGVGAGKPDEKRVDSEDI